MGFPFSVRHSETRASLSSASVVIAVLMLALLSSCAQTVPGSPAGVEQVGSGQSSPAITGFFGSDYSLLQPGADGRAAMVYVNPSASWSQYNRIMLEPIEFWDESKSSISPSDQHMLTAYFYNQLKENLQKRFTLVDHGGPGVVVLQVAIVNASAATPSLRSVSVVIPPARILNGIQSLATGTYAFVGSAESEMKVTDSASGQLLAAAIDRFAGGMGLASAAVWQWGDAENSMEYWAKKIASRLQELQGRGTPPPTPINPQEPGGVRVTQ
jgi:hypothetical protein